VSRDRVLGVIRNHIFGISVPNLPIHYITFIGLRMVDSLHRFMWNLAWSRGTWVRIGLAKFRANQRTGVGTWPQNGKKNPLFGKESPCRGEPFDRIFTVVRGFSTPSNRALAFYIWDDSLHWLRSYCWETARRSFTPNSSVHPVKNCALDKKNDSHLFNDLDVLYHHAKFGEDRTTCTGCKVRKHRLFWRVILHNTHTQIVYH